MKTIGQKRYEDVRLDALFALMKDRPDRQIALEVLERFFHRHQLQVQAPQLGWIAGLLAVVGIIGRPRLGRGPHIVLDVGSHNHLTCSLIEQTVDVTSTRALGRAVLPDDPVVLYESGLLQEMFATHWQTAAPGGATRGISWRPPLDSVLANRPVRLDKAEQWLRASLRNNPKNVMARLHLGRVQMMRRENDEALELLRGVFESTPDSATAYLAAIFTGALHEREGRLAEATLAYRQAIEKFTGVHRGILYLYHPNYIVAFPKAVKGYKGVPDGLIRIKGVSWQ